MTGLRARALLAVALLASAALLAAADPWRVPASGAQAPFAEQIVTLPTRPNVTMKVLIGAPAGGPQGNLILFPGGNGARHFSEQNGTIRASTNFLLAVRGLLVEQGFLTAAVDTPSDRPNGMNDAFRTSAAHVTDIRALQQYLAQNGAPIYFVGTSRGTISAAYLARQPGEGPARAQGVVLTSSMEQVANQPLAEIAIPTLVVHHAEDTCNETPYAVAQNLLGLLTGAPSANLLTVRGGLPPVDPPCQPRAPHGYYGREAVVVQAIVAWLRGQSVPATVD